MILLVTFFSSSPKQSSIDSELNCVFMISFRIWQLLKCKSIWIDCRLLVFQPASMDMISFRREKNRRIVLRDLLIFYQRHWKLSSYTNILKLSNYVPHWTQTFRQQTIGMFVREEKKSEFITFVKERNVE